MKFDPVAFCAANLSQNTFSETFKSTFGDPKPPDGVDPTYKADLNFKLNPSSHNLSLNFSN